MDIEIPQELADAEGVPEDLDANVVGPYQFASPERRKVAGHIYAVGAGGAVAGAAVGVAAGLWWVAGALAALAAHQYLSAHPLQVDDGHALATAARSVDMLIGHSSAALRFEGVLARPVWNVLVYDAGDPPSQRALVQISGITGELVRDVYVEHLPGAQEPASV